MKIMKAVLAAGAALALAGAAEAFTVSVGAYAANPGRWVTVPVRLVTSASVAYAAVEVTYDPETLVCTRVAEGSLGGEFSELSTSEGTLSAKVFFDSERKGATGELARVTFFVRDGTAGKFSDVTVARVEAGDASGVRDIFVDDPVQTVNGMVRSLAAGASAARLEAAFRVAPQTALGTLVLADGDGLVADADGEPVRVSGAVTAAGSVPVDAPLGGWQTGTYALLTTPTTGLKFTLADAADATIRAVTADGLVTYYADVTVEGSVEIVADSGTLPAATRAQVKSLLADELAAHAEVTSVTVKGDSALVAVAADLGIAPQLDVLGTEATATYQTPTLEIVAFEPTTGRVRIKVTPGEGNAIRAPLATGCVHVYGTSDLGEKMRYISGTAFDLAPYLKDATKGEADLTVALGSHTFIKVKVETTIKQEGEQE